MPPRPDRDDLLTLAGPLVRAEGARASSRLEEEVVALFDRLRDRLLRYLTTFGLSVSDSEEILQETFLALFQHLKLGKPRDNLDAWLFRVAHNLGLKRRNQIRRGFELFSEGVTTEEVAADPDLTPEVRLLHHETRQRLRAVVKGLPEQDGRCLALRAEGLRYREIAEILNMSLGAVSISLTRSLARLARVAGG
jgi:RNA polymerase sigma-70 factor, ECF subfamily